MTSLTDIVAIIVENALESALVSITGLIWNSLGRPIPNPPESLENVTQDPEEVSRTGIEQYFRRQQIPVRVNGGCEIDRWTISVRGDMKDVESVSQQITHVIERNRLRSGQTGVLQQRLEMNFS